MPQHITRVLTFLFLGNQVGATDVDFMIGNKITHIINTCNPQVPNNSGVVGPSNEAPFLHLNRPNKT